MDDPSRDKTAFTCPFGLCQFKVMPFGPKKCPCHIPEIDGDDVKRVLDDITVCSPSWQRNFSDLQAVFRLTVNMKLQFEGI